MHLDALPGKTSEADFSSLLKTRSVRLGSPAMQMSAGLLVGVKNVEFCRTNVAKGFSAQHGNAACQHADYAAVPGGQCKACGMEQLAITGHRKLVARQ